MRQARDMSDISVISGPVHRPGDGGYETGRSGFNLAIKHHPELIVEAAGVADVTAAVRLAWDTEESLEKFVPDYQAPAPGSQRIGIAFLADSPAEVDALYDELISLGYKGENAPWDAIWGQRYAVVQDSDGNGIDLFAPLS